MHGLRVHESLEAPQDWGTNSRSKRCAACQDLNRAMRQGTERSLNAPRRAAHDAGAEVGGSAVSVPRVESPTSGQPIAAPISVAPMSKVLSGCT